jgi:type II secretory pathway component GspD/PulD (secretin)
MTIDVAMRTRYVAAHRPFEVTNMSFRFRALAVWALSFGFAAAAFAQATVSQPEREPSEEPSAWAYVVIKLKYADAEEIAQVLRQLLPPTVRVVPYAPTNSLLIAGDPAVLEEIEARETTKK